ncbi:MAG: hypothetical protein V1495_05305 [Pseudomonadota bacterium]
MRSKIVAFAVVSFLALACGPYKPGVNTAPMQEKEKIVLLDHGLTYYLNFVKEGISRLPGGQLQVKLEVENKRDKDVWTDVQVIFRGEDGFEIEKTDWQPFLFHRRTVTLYQQNSLNTGAADYRILIRDAKSN